jgi:tyrosyl-tRNA synthetase
VVETLLRSGLASSRRDARQLLSQGSVYVNGSRVPEDRPLDTGDVLHDRWLVLRRGRANQAVLVVTD